MALRSHAHQKASPDTASTTVQYASRPFAPQAEAEQAQTLPELQTQVETAQRFGHHLTDFSLSSHSSSPPLIQPKLAIGAPGDKYEQEADRVAQQVVQRLNAPQVGGPGPEATVQRQTPEDEELQMKPMLQMRGNAKTGGQASPDLESAINQARGGGQSLDTGLQRSMGQAMGANFSRVRVHTDNRADQLNRSIQAKAFTTGQDVFFRQGAYQPGSRGGQELLAHELTHVVQQRQTIQTSSQGVIQRNVGFEFEVGGYPVNKLNQNMTPEQSAGTTLLEGADLGNTGLEKGTNMARGPGFELQVDQGVRGFHLEFVTAGTGFPETDAGRNQLKTTIRGMQDLGHKIYNLTNTEGLTLGPEDAQQRLVHTGEIPGGIATRPETVIRGFEEMSAEPQATAGIRLDQMAALMKNMAPQPGEPQEETNRRGKPRSVLALKSNTADRAVLNEAPSAAQTAILNFRNQMAAGNVPLPPEFGSKSLVGLIALVYTYLRKATTPVGDYTKTLFPLLGITRFDAMFRMLPNDDKIPFAEVPQRFVDISLAAAHMEGAGATSFFAGGFAGSFDLRPQEVKDTLRRVTRQDWLSHIPQGRDQLYELNADLGKLDRGDQVGNTHTFNPRKPNTRTEAPVLELRRLAGRVPINKWTNLSLDIFDFISNFNDLKTEQFELRRHDPVGETKYK
jgi:Domain of unknown function (DUF4157)